MGAMNSYAGKLAGPGTRQPFLRRFMPAVLLVALCWLVFGFNNLLLNGSLNIHGIIPRHLQGLPGILWAPFLHGSLKHLIANTVPLLILGGIVCARNQAEFGFITVAGIALGGAITWLLARSAIHIGASGLVFCFFGYLASLAYFRRTFGSLLLSAACVFTYGGILRGLLPGTAGVSWESHIAGLVSGIVLAGVASKFRSGKNDATPLEPGLPPTIRRLG